MMKLHAYTVMCPPTMAQEAAVEALRMGDEEVVKMRREYNQRRRVVVSRLNDAGLDCFEPGARSTSSPPSPGPASAPTPLQSGCLRKRRWRGTGHGLRSQREGFVRCSYATSLPLLEEALSRMAAFVKRVGV